METPQNQLETWAVVELMGHQKEVGFVTMQYYGTACMFKIDVPELSEREHTLTRSRWIGDTLAPPGTTIRLGAKQGRTRLVGVSSVYAMNPCDRASAIALLETSQDEVIKIVSLAGVKQLSLSPEEPVEGYPDEDDEDEDEEDQVPA
jgi:hypothetical protein